ncbi:MAG: type II toxin-antitoxin system ParD family antitoxin [Planctomycetes bacterium]|nr:type II toxin-antitoxin system ParD family antitoxin [Planctomycetota bacterium]
MTTLNVSLPENMRKWIEARVAEGRFSSASEYLRSLVREDQKRTADEQLEKLLLEGLESTSTEMTPEDWKEIRREVGARVAKKLKGRK